MPSHEHRPPTDAPAPAPSPVAAAAGATDTIGRLKELESLLERGAVTQAEFDARKRKLLGASA